MVGASGPKLVICGPKVEREEFVTRLGFCGVGRPVVVVCGAGSSCSNSSAHEYNNMQTARRSGWWILHVVG
jgi:hypothetical protein